MSDVFDTMAEAFRPDNSPVIRDINVHEHRCYVVTTECENAGKPRHIFHINKADVEDWIDETHPEWLEWTIDKPHPVTGQHVQQVGVITAEEYASEHMCDAEWHEFLIANQYTTYPYDPD